MNEPSEFNKDKLYVTHFANDAAIAIERAKMTREMVMKMIKMSELRDPHETGNHVNRVGAYAIEIYDKWASNHGIGEDAIKKTKDGLRISAMLHDVGKVAISDAILKKLSKVVIFVPLTEKFPGCSPFGSAVIFPVAV